MDKKHLTLRQITLFGMLGALTFGAKVAMAGLPNIEPVSLFVMLFAVTFGWKALYPVYLYVMLEILCYGLGLWNVNYLYAWAILAVASIAMRKLRNPIWWALLSGLFGLSFGLLCCPGLAVFWAIVSFGAQNLRRCCGFPSVFALRLSLGRAVLSGMGRC